MSDITARRAKARSNLLLAAAAWTVWVWGTRIWNILRDTDPAHGTGFKAVHTVLAVVSVAFAAALAVVGMRLRREAGSRDGAPPATAGPGAGHQGTPPARRETAGR